MKDYIEETHFQKVSQADADNISKYVASISIGPSLSLTGNNNYQGHQLLAEFLWNF